MSATATKQIHTIHHVLFPTTDMDRTAEFYTKVFGFRRVNVPRKGNLPVLIMTNGNFDIHFTPVDEPTLLAPYHFALEVEDWDSFLAHLEQLSIEYAPIRERPQNQSKTSEITDPDGHIVEVVWHGDRDW